MARKPSNDLLLKAARLVSSTFDSYEDQMMRRKTELLRVYDEYSSFEESIQNEWSNSFKINKAQEIVEKVLPSLTAKNPRWTVTVRDIRAFNTPEELAEAAQGPLGDLSPDVFGPKFEQAADQARVVQDYLTYLFEEYSLMDDLELWAKNGVVDGKGYCQVTYKYEKAIVPKTTVVMDEDGEEMMDEEGEPITVQENEEVVTGEYPTVQIVDWSDLYYDSRYISQKDRPAWIRIKEGVRLADLKRNKNKYFNLEELELIAHASKDKSPDGFKEKIRSIQGLNIEKASKVDENSLTLRYYYGWFNKVDDPSKEAFYKIVLCNDMLVIGMEEISFCPIEEWKCFPDPKSAHAWGFVEPILGLQQEFNFKKNSASEYINKHLRRQRIWSANSGIDPQSLNDPVIQTDKDAPTALANIPELQFGSMAPDYFQEQNDFERQIQSVTHTVDTSNPRNQQALTNTATGAKIKFYESNKVLDAVRKRWERALERIAYKLIQATFENMDENIVFKKTDTEGYWFINKELLRDAMNKYKIKIEVNSSSYADADSRREDALGWMTILQQIDAQLAARQSPQRVNFLEAMQDIAATFEKKDPSKYITMQQQVPNVGDLLGGAGPTRPIPQEGEKPTEAERITENVVGQI